MTDGGSESVALEPAAPGATGAERREFESERLDAGAVFERYADDIYRYCRARGCSVEDAEDITAEVFAQTLTRLRTLSWRRRPVVAFLYTVASRRVNDLHRRHAKQPRETAAEAAASGDTGEQGQQRAALTRALQRLPEREQLAVVLRIIQGCSFAEVAATVGGSEKAVKSLVYRGLDHMQASLREEGIEP